MNITSHTCGEIKPFSGGYFLPLGGRGGGESRPEWNSLCIIVLTPASPPPRAGPPSGRGSTPSHSVGAARCAWRTRTGRQINPSEVWRDEGKQREIKRTRDLGTGSFHMEMRGHKIKRGGDEQRTDMNTREEMDRQEWAGRNKMIIGQSRAQLSKKKITGLLRDTMSEVQCDDRDKVDWTQNLKKIYRTKGFVANALDLTWRCTGLVLYVCEHVHYLPQYADQQREQQDAGQGGYEDDPPGDPVLVSETGFRVDHYWDLMGRDQWVKP